MWSDVKLIIIPCTCGRKDRDIKDYAVIREQYKRNSYGKESSYSTIVCMRKGCLGMKRSGKTFIDKISQIWGMDYNCLKKEERGYKPEET